MNSSISYNITNIQKDISLASFTTMRTGGNAKFFVQVTSLQELKDAYSFAKQKQMLVHVLGGGSNTIFSDAGFNGLVIKNSIKGIKLISGAENKSNLNNKETANSKSALSLPKDAHVIVEAMSGEDWDNFVLETINSGWYGLENLSLIPGTVGASPIQNIGAYGTEVCDFITEVCAYDADKDKQVIFSKEECKFGYRTSIFKNAEFSHLFVLSVKFVLHTNSNKINISYKDLANWYSSCEQNNLDCSKSSKGVRDAVCKIRTEKLPPLDRYGTAGSFFKNPIISEDHYMQLVKRYPKLPGFPAGDGKIKVPLGWILDNICNAKSLKIGDASVYEKQALVLVNSGGASTNDMLTLGNKLAGLVKESTNIEIEREVVYVA